MKRDIEQDLLHWKQQSNRMPLLLRGARQVGKTYVIEKFGETHFEKVLTINFELQPDMIQCFNSLDPTDILKTITLLTSQKIQPGKTLLFLDEIQDCPNAIRALRYFKEKMPELHVIGAGSLLEFTLNDADFRMPVGRVQSLYLKPLSFQEYLTAIKQQELREYLAQATLKTTINQAVHQRLLKLVREYMALGGMPAVLADYLTNHDFNHSQQIQTALLNTYRHDFGKYATKTAHKYLKRLFEKAPLLIAEHFKYVKVDPDMRARDIKDALETLKNSGLIYTVYATAASGVPLISLLNEKKFKILFVDVGLVMRAGKLDIASLLNDNILLINKGILAEQFVGQELLAYQSRFEEGSIYFWCREKASSMAEVDFVTTVNAKIIPLEVKAGSTGRLKSLKVFMEEKKLNLGVRISQLPLQFENKILSLPIYMVGELERLVLSVLHGKNQ